ncbi:MAG: fused MFS/spermidine synthase [Geobacter sp.]|nr:fused MFS/spermidine synthase [Geobacter sp.]
MKNKIVFWGFGLSGLAALIYEINWTRELSLVIGSTTYALSTVLSAFMTGLAIGSYVGGKMIRNKDAIAIFGWLQLLIGFTGVGVHFAIVNLSGLYALTYFTFKGNPAFYFFAQFIIVFLVMIIPTAFMGATFPVAVKSCAIKLESFAEDAGGLYSINTIGAVIGAIGAGFFLIPVLGLKKTIFFAAFLNISIAILVLGKRISKRTAVFMVVGLASLFYMSPSIPKLFFNVYYANRIPSYGSYKASLNYFDTIWEKEDVEGTVQVSRGGDPPAYGLTIRGKPEGVVRFPEDAEQLLMAYLPLAARPDARSFLKIGLGPGVTLNAASKVKNLSNIDAVELNGAVIEAVRKFFFPALYADPRIQFIAADARGYLSLPGTKYDVITAQPSDPTDDSSGHLFSREYYEVVVSRLSGKGVYAQYVPYYLLGREGTDIIVKTFATVFPYVYAWNLNTNNAILLGSLAPITDSPDVMMGRIEGYRKNLSSNCQYIAGGSEVKEILREHSIPVNTDDKPVVEFLASLNLVK